MQLWALQKACINGELSYSTRALCSSIIKDLFTVLGSQEKYPARLTPLF